jgi:hypothetical protein
MDIPTKYLLSIEIVLFALPPQCDPTKKEGNNDDRAERLSSLFPHQPKTTNLNEP